MACGPLKPHKGNGWGVHHAVHRVECGGAPHLGDGELACLVGLFHRFERVRPALALQLRAVELRRGGGTRRWVRFTTERVRFCTAYRFQMSIVASHRPFPQKRKGRDQDGEHGCEESDRQGTGIRCPATVHSEACPLFLLPAHHFRTSPPSPLPLSKCKAGICMWKPPPWGAQQEGGERVCGGGAASGSCSDRT